MKKRKRYLRSQLGLLKNAKFFALLAVLVVVLAIPITLTLLNQNTYQPSLAAATTTLSFAQPTVTGTAGGNISLDLMLNPGASNLVSDITLYITYDGSVIQAAQNGFVPGDGTASFSPCATPGGGLLCVFDGPTYNTCNGNQCRSYIEISIGNDFTKAIKTPTKIATLNFTAQANGVSQVGFDPQTRILSIASTDSPGENVLQSTTPSIVNIGNVAVSITPGPTTQPTPTGTIAPSPTDTPMPTQPLPTSPNGSPAPTNPPQPTKTPGSGGNSCNDKQEEKREKREEARERTEELREQKINHDFQMSNAGGNHHGGCLGGYDPNNPNSNPNCIDNGSGGIIPANQSPNGTPTDFWSWILHFLGLR